MSRPAAASKALKMEVAVPVCLDATKCIAVCCLGYIQITKVLSSSFRDLEEKKKKKEGRKKRSYSSGRVRIDAPFRQEQLNHVLPRVHSRHVKSIVIVLSVKRKTEPVFSVTFNDFFFFLLSFPRTNRFHAIGRGQYGAIYKGNRLINRVLPRPC